MGVTYDPDVWGQEEDTYIYATFAEIGLGMMHVPAFFSCIAPGSSWH